MAVKKAGYDDNKNKIDICFDKESIIDLLEKKIDMKINSYILKNDAYTLSSNRNMSNMLIECKKEISVEIEFPDDIFDVNVLHKLAKKYSNVGWNTCVDEVYRKLTLI